MYMNHVMRKTDFCICENRGTDQQLCSNCIADQCLCCHFIDRSTFFSYLKFQASSLFSDCTDLVRNPRPVLSSRSSFRLPEQCLTVHELRKSYMACMKSHSHTDEGLHALKWNNNDCFAIKSNAFGKSGKLSG